MQQTARTFSNCSRRDVRQFVPSQRRSALLDLHLLRVDVKEVQLPVDGRDFALGTNEALRVVAASAILAVRGGL